jgi:hypothetical protein
MKWWKRFRSAVTGLFVTRKYAQEHPDTTVGETVKKD